MPPLILGDTPYLVKHIIEESFLLIIDRPLAEENGMPMFLTHRIEEIVANSTDTRHAIGAFALQERMHLSDYTIADIARETFSSKASVTRFAKALGYPGWREFIRDFMAEVRYETNHDAIVDMNYPFNEGDTQETIVNAIADVRFEAIADTMRALNRGMLELGVRYLQRAQNVWVFGISPNDYLGSLFCRKLLSVGKTAQVVRSGEYGLVARSLGPNDCALIISYSGNNPHIDPLRHLQELNGRRVPVIALTSEGDTYLRRHARCVLTISSREALYAKISTFATEASTSYLLDLLFACYFARSYQRNLERKLAGGKVLEKGRQGAAETV